MGSGSAHYAASKGAVIGFSRALAAELAPSIRVNCICPGHTRTGFNDPFFNIRGGYEVFLENMPAIIALQREAEPEEIAQGDAFPRLRRVLVRHRHAPRDRRRRGQMTRFRRRLRT